jgi:hypothetical protein
VTHNQPQRREQLTDLDLLFRCECLKQVVQRLSAKTIDTFQWNLRKTLKKS